ncbi:hypothetical protein [Aeribacillus composti]|jgi:anti-anti-sigma regulatory factor|uniref:hypothetical protein n=1 Tax=Aeribacillus composti TaxID=1868734 RepID=UPI003D232263
MNNRNYFFCYNKNVSDFLKSKGIEFITVAIHPKTKKMFSLYKIDDILQKALNEYKEKNHEK